ncbi:MAG: alpha-galactosidase [Deltaproteobacteria bacterium]|nr:alpha-galactosidase [Deltaproteobacteria bacterium]
MSRPAAVVRHPLAGSLEPVRLGVRWRQGEDAFFGEGRLAPGGVAVGPWRLAVAVDAEGDSASYDVDVSNAGDAAMELEAVVLGFRWCGPDTSHVRFLRHGWQSWSTTEARLLDDAGEPAFPSGPWLRGMWHALGEPPPDRAGWHESDLCTAASAGDAALLAGVLERGRNFGVIYLRRDAEGVRVEVELRCEAPVAPGATRETERVRVALGGDAQLLLEQYAEEHGRLAGARTHAPFRAGWCTWYHFFHDVTEDDVLRNLEALAASRDEIPVGVVQIDDGYQRAIGDWLEPADTFPRGIAPLAQEIRAAGFEAGLWTAPFCAVSGSRIFQEHPEWLLRDADGLFRGMLHPMWTPDASVYVLDASLDAVCLHLESVFAQLVEMGFTYQKLDFLYSQAMRAQGADPHVSRAQRLRRGLEAIRRGCGDRAFLLGCGCPLGPAVGIVDGMRIGPDVAPSWESDAAVRIPGCEPTQPATKNAVRNVLNRLWMHRRLWQNDPDCLMARTEDTALSADEAATLAHSVAASGGMAIFSDDLPQLDADARRLVSETLKLARRVDAGGLAGTARAAGFLEEAVPGGIVARTLSGGVVAGVNAGDVAVARSLDAAALGLEEVEPLQMTLEPHASRLVRVPGRASLAVFCDMDGTFIDKDVGATLAQQYAADRRPGAWARYLAGEMTAWEFNLEILDGLPCSEEQLEAFLRSISLDPGATALMDWCAKRGVPFRVLSDGFDYNLDRLQELLGVRFEYDANRLWYEGNVWKIAAGPSDPSCFCGTGVCKARCIDELRAARPEAVTVHVGNGRVSDLCGALAADVIFAKDSLAEELWGRGVRYEPFDTLHDVIAGLEAVWDDPHSIGS